MPKKVEKKPEPEPEPVPEEPKKIVKKKYKLTPKICTFCQKSFRDSWKLKNHIRSAHES